jgi:serine/threonine protein kinase
MKRKPLLTLAIPGDSEEPAEVPIPPLRPGEPSALLSLNPDDIVLEKVLGHGSFSTVYRAHYRPLDATVALKVIKRDVSCDASRQLAAELRSLHRSTSRATECAALVRIIDAFYSDGSVSVLLEFMGGGSLLDVLRRAPQHRLPNESAAALASKSVLTGLHYLHKTLHVIHRDIKPANLVSVMDVHDSS